MSLPYLTRVVSIRAVSADGRRCKCVCENADGRKLTAWLPYQDVPYHLYVRYGKAGC